MPHSFDEANNTKPNIKRSKCYIKERQIYNSKTNKGFEMVGVKKDILGYIFWINLWLVLVGSDKF